MYFFADPFRPTVYQMFSIVWRGVLLYFNIAEVLLDAFVVFVSLHCTCISKVSFRITTILLMNAKHNLTMAKVFVVMRVEFPNQNLIAMLSDESEDMQCYLMSYRIRDIFGRSIGKYFLLLFNIANALSIGTIPLRPRHLLLYGWTTCYII